MVHVDDFISSGTQTSLSWFKTKLEGRFVVKSKVIGSADDEETECRVLNRIIRRCGDGWEYEADQRHAELIVKSLDMQEAKFVTTLGEGAKREKEEEEALLDNARAHLYRQLAARANYMTLDRSDTQFAVKEMCRGMAKPTLVNWRQLKRLARYLKGRARAVSRFPFPPWQSVVDGFSDSDWVGVLPNCPTSGGAQRIVTLSSAKAELVAAVKTCSECVGISQVASDWRLHLSGHVHVDSSAAIGVARRRGNGKLRHVRVGTLWIRELVEEGDISLQKIAGATNVADIFIKNVLERHVGSLGFVFSPGRAQAGLTMQP